MVSSLSEISLQDVCLAESRPYYQIARNLRSPNIPLSPVLGKMPARQQKLYRGLAVRQPSVGRMECPIGFKISNILTPPLRLAANYDVEQGEGF